MRFQFLNKGCGEHVEAKRWKNAGADILILKEAKAEHAALPWPLHSLAAAEPLIDRRAWLGRSKDLNGVTSA